MAKLSPSLQALLHAPSAGVGALGAPAGLRDVYERIAADAARRRLGTRPWLAVSVRRRRCAARGHRRASADRPLVRGAV